MRSDGVILNVKTQEVTAINPPWQFYGFKCLSESVMEKQSQLLCLVCDDKNDVHLMRYSQINNSITSVRNYGKS